MNMYAVRRADTKSKLSATPVPRTGPPVNLRPAGAHKNKKHPPKSRQRELTRREGHCG